MSAPSTPTRDFAWSGAPLETLLLFLQPSNAALALVPQITLGKCGAVGGLALDGGREPLRISAANAIAVEASLAIRKRSTSPEAPSWRR